GAGTARTTRSAGHCAGASHTASGRGCARTGCSASRRSRARTGACAAAAATTAAEAATTAEAAATAADVHAPEIALAHGGLPGRLDLTGFDTAQDSDVVHDVGIGSTADRAVLVLDRRGSPAGTSLVVAPLTHHFREMHRLGV